MCFQWDSGPLDHIGFVVQPLPDGTIKTVEGNTSAMPGTGQAQGEGDGVFVKIRPRSVCAAFIRIPGNVADPQPKAGFDDWAKWVKGGKKGKRPDVPEKVPQAWWAKLSDDIDAKHDAHPPAHVKAPARRRPLARPVASRRRLRGGGRSEAPSSNQPGRPRRDRRRRRRRRFAMARRDSPSSARSCVCSIQPENVVNDPSSVVPASKSASPPTDRPTSRPRQNEPKTLTTIVPTGKTPPARTGTRSSIS